jgi:hypothetical protein
MLLYQLAMELDERSPDVAERAEALGLGTVGPTSELTAEQIRTLRAAYGKTDPGPVEGPVMVIGPKKAAGEAEPGDQPAPSSGRGRRVVAVLACVLALGAAVAFFAVQSAPAEEQRQQTARELREWEQAPAATVAPEVEAAVTFPGNVPRDKAKLCAAAKTVADEEASQPPMADDQLDFTEVRRWAASRGAWRAALDQMVKTGPTDSVPDITDYRDAQAQYYARLAQGSDSELRALADGVELNEFDGMGDAVSDARDDLNAAIGPICGPIAG